MTAASATRTMESLARPAYGALGSPDRGIGHRATVCDSDCVRTSADSLSIAAKGGSVPGSSPSREARFGGRPPSPGRRPPPSLNPDHLGGRAEHPGVPRHDVEDVLARAPF